MNLRPSGYEPDELPGCSTPRQGFASRVEARLIIERARDGRAARERGFDHAFDRFGGDLLSHVLGRSTIGAAALNGRVRDGIGCFARARATKPVKRMGRRLAPDPVTSVFPRLSGVFGSKTSREGVRFANPSSSGSDQAYRAISTGQLNASPRLHLQPIDVVVFHGPQGRPGFEGGFPLRCLQRLSCPFIATLHCRWHDNRSTSGTFTPVLSY